MTSVYLSVLCCFDDILNRQFKSRLDPFPSKLSFNKLAVEQCLVWFKLSAANGNLFKFIFFHLLKFYKILLNFHLFHKYLS